MESGHRFYLSAVRTGQYGDGLTLKNDVGEATNQVQYCNKCSDALWSLKYAGNFQQAKMVHIKSESKNAYWHANSAWHSGGSYGWSWGGENNGQAWWLQSKSASNGDMLTEANMNNVFRLHTKAQDYVFCPTGEGGRMSWSNSGGKCAYENGWKLVDIDYIPATTTQTTTTATTTTATTTTATTITSTTTTTTTSRETNNDLSDRLDALTTETNNARAAGADIATAVSALELRLEAKNQQLAEAVAAANQKLEAQETQHQTEMDNLRIEMRTQIAAAIEAAAPCAQWETSTNGKGQSVCTMRVDQVKSLREE